MSGFGKGMQGVGRLPAHMLRGLRLLFPHRLQLGQYALEYERRIIRQGHIKRGTPRVWDLDVGCSAHGLIGRGDTCHQLRHVPTFSVRQFGLTA